MSPAAGPHARRSAAALAPLSLAALTTAIAGGCYASREPGITDSEAREPDAASEATGTADGAQNADSGPDASASDATEPLPWVHVAAGGNTTCGIRSDGSVECWGLACGEDATTHAWSCWGRTCAGEDACRTFGLPVDDLPSYDVSAPPAGEFRSVTLWALEHCGIRTDGHVDCWGLLTPELWPASDPVLDLAKITNLEDRCALLQDGRLWCNQHFGEPSTGRYLQLTSGQDHMCALRIDREVVCWGAGDCGANVEVSQACDTRRVPTGKFVQVSAGKYHTCGVREGGTLACWGAGTQARECMGSLWDDPECGQSLPPDGDFTMVAAGASSTCAIRIDGSLTCWGAGASRNDCNQADDSDRHCGQSQPPTGDFVEVAVGFRHACALTTNGEITCWGAGTMTGECYVESAAGSAGACAQSLPPAPIF